MEKDPALRTMSPSNWAKLPPRTTVIEELLALAGGMPKKLSGMCNSCDTRISDQWCTASSNPGSVTELAHLAQHEEGRLRPAELTVVLAWLNSAKK